MSTKTITPPLDWPEMYRLEPRLLALTQQARREAHRFADHWAHYEQLKQKLFYLVGWRAANPELRSSEAYEIAHLHLLNCIEGRDL